MKYKSRCLFNFKGVDMVNMNKKRIKLMDYGAELLCNITTYELTPYIISTIV